MVHDFLQGTDKIKTITKGDQQQGVLSFHL
jgi:hypothetical protein